MHQPIETYVLFVNQSLQNVVTIPDSVSLCTERAVYNLLHISVHSLPAYQHCMPTESVEACILRVLTATEQVPWLMFSRTMALWEWKLTFWSRNFTFKF